MNTLDEIKERLSDVESSTSMSQHHQDIIWLVSEAERLERDNFTLRKNQEYVLEPKIIDMNSMINDLAADKLIAEEENSRLKEKVREFSTSRTDDYCKYAIALQQLQSQNALLMSVVDAAKKVNDAVYDLSEDKIWLHELNTQLKEALATLEKEGE